MSDTSGRYEAKNEVETLSDEKEKMLDDPLLRIGHEMATNWPRNGHEIAIRVHKRRVLRILPVK